MSHIPHSFRDVQGLLLASVKNIEYKSPVCFIYVAWDQQAVEFLLMKVYFEKSWAPHPGVEPLTFSAAGPDAITNLTTHPSEGVS